MSNYDALFEHLMTRELPDWCSSFKAYRCARAHYDCVQWCRENPTASYMSEPQILAVARRWQEHARRLWAKEQGEAA